MHSSTFILYLVSAFFNYACMTIYVIYSQSNKSLMAYTWAVTIYSICSFIAQMFLVVILWELGKDKRDPMASQRDGKKVAAKRDKRSLHKPSQKSNYYEVEETDPNEEFQMEVLSTQDAHLQAKIWNRFVKNDPKLGGEQGEFMITAEIINE